MNQLTAGDICTRNLESVTPNTKVREALDLMHDRQHSSLLVLLLDEPVGIVTERDLVRCLAKIVNFPDLRVRDIMSSPVLTFSADKKAMDAFLLMRQERIRHLVILDRDYSACGLLSLTDLLYKFAPACIPESSTVGELMVHPVFSAPPDETVRQILSEMARRSLSCVVIVQNKRPIGLLSERDLPRILNQKPIPLDSPVAAVMTPPQPPIPPHMPTRDVIALMQERGVRRLVVADSAGTIQGIVTQSVLGRAVSC